MRIQYNGVNQNCHTESSITVKSRNYISVFLEDCAGAPQNPGMAVYPENNDGPCRSESYIAPLLRQRCR